MHLAHFGGRLAVGQRPRLVEHRQDARQVGVRHGVERQGGCGDLQPGKRVRQARGFRLRRLAARRELEQDASIRRRVGALYASVYPSGHLQERSVGAAAALARFGKALPTVLVEAAGDPCPGHKLLQL